MRWEEFHEVSLFGEREGISLFSFNRRRDFGGKLIFDELSEGFVVSVSFKLVPTTLKDSRDEIKSNLAEVFEEQDVFLSVILYIPIADKIRDVMKENFDVIDIDFL